MGEVALNAKIDGTLKREVEKACVDRGVTIKAAVTAALSRWLSGAIPEASKGPPTKDAVSSEGTSGLELQTPKGPEHLTAEEWAWVSRVLKIVRGGRGEALRPLDTNLDSFVLLTDLLTGGPSERKGDAISQAGADIARAMEDLHTDARGLDTKLDRMEKARGKTENNPGVVRRRSKGH